jgi:hypothetical protein
MEPYDEETDRTCATNAHMSPTSVRPLTTETVSTSTHKFQHMEDDSIVARHLDYMYGYTGSPGPHDQQSQRFSMTSASAQTDGGSTATSTAPVAKQDLSRVPWRVERQEPVLVQTKSTKDPPYEHVFAASFQTGAGESHYDQLRRGQGDRPLQSSFPETDRPLQPPCRLASSCDRCRKAKAKCEGDPKRGPCKNCQKFARRRPNSEGEAICTWNHLESSDKRYLEQRGYLPARS